MSLARRRLKMHSLTLYEVLESYLTTSKQSTTSDVSKVPFSSDNNAQPCASPSLEPALKTLFETSFERV